MEPEIKYRKSFKEFINLVKDFTSKGNEVIQHDNDVKQRYGYMSKDLSKVWFCTLRRIELFHFITTDPFWKKFSKACKNEKDFRNKMLEYLNNKL